MRRERSRSSSVRTPVAARSGIVCRAVGVTQRALQVAEGRTKDLEASQELPVTARSF